MDREREGFRIHEDILTGYEGPGGDVTVPEGVRAIGPGAFEGRGDLISVRLPDSCREIRFHAFEMCQGLERIHFPRGLLSIGSYAFYNCRSLMEAKLPDSVRTIGERAFSGCAGLKILTLPGWLRSLGEGAFEYCPGLTDLVMPEGITEIPSMAFQRCASLQRVVFPRGLVSIEEEAFAGTGILEADLPDSLRRIERGAFMLCGKLARVRLPEGIQRIGYKAFFLCPGLTCLRVPAGVTEILGTISVRCLICYTPYAASRALVPVYLGGSPFDLEESRQTNAVLGFFYALDRGMTEISRWRGDYARFIRDHLEEYTDLALRDRRVLLFLLEEGLLDPAGTGEYLEVWQGKQDLEITAALLQYRRERTEPGGPDGPDGQGGISL